MIKNNKINFLKTVSGLPLLILLMLDNRFHSYLCKSPLSRIGKFKVIKSFQIIFLKTVSGSPLLILLMLENKFYSYLAKSLLSRVGGWSGGWVAGRVVGKN